MHNNDNLQCILITKKHNKGEQKNFQAKKKELSFFQKSFTSKSRSKKKQKTQKRGGM